MIVKGKSVRLAAILLFAAFVVALPYFISVSKAGAAPVGSAPGCDKPVVAEGSTITLSCNLNKARWFRISGLAISPHEVNYSIDCGPNAPALASAIQPVRGYFVWFVGQGKTKNNSSNEDIDVLTGSTDRQVSRLMANNNCVLDVTVDPKKGQKRGARALLSWGYTGQWQGNVHASTIPIG